MYILFILILWTWGLTPLWVNILGTIICFFGISFKTARLFSIFKDTQYE